MCGSATVAVAVTVTVKDSVVTGHPPAPRVTVRVNIGGESTACARGHGPRGSP